jgi:hypothetical protein
MYFPIILAALVIITAAYLLRQYWYGALDADEPSAPDLLPSRADSDSPRTRKAA